MPYGVLLVDDHKLLRDGLKAILEGTTDFRVVAEAGNGTTAVALCAQLEPDLVVMDLLLPGINGIEVTTEIVRRSASTKVIILTMNDDENSVVAAFRSGARGFLVKKASSSDLLAALRTVAKGGCYVGSGASNHLLNRIQTGDLAVTHVPDPIAVLSPREQQVLRLVATGQTTKDIAILLGLEIQTVRTYRKMVMKKIGVTNAAGLTQIAFSAGLTTFAPLSPNPRSACHDTLGAKNSIQQSDSQPG
jgi:two-component system response regulator NreC